MDTCYVCDIAIDQHGDEPHAFVSTAGHRHEEILVELRRQVEATKLQAEAIVRLVEAVDSLVQQSVWWQEAWRNSR